MLPPTFRKNYSSIPIISLFFAVVNAVHIKGAAFAKIAAKNYRARNFRPGNAFLNKGRSVLLLLYAEAAVVELGSVKASGLAILALPVVIIGSALGSLLLLFLLVVEAHGK